MEREDKYDISKYTDKELYDILDLTNPSDRELEAKIIHMINKYANMQNESGYKLAIFFQNIYNHFFDITENDNETRQDDENQDDEPIQEGLENMNTKKQSIDITNSSNTVNTTLIEYTQDKFGLNPLLKQTITRIISLDSQYRDNKDITIPTKYTLNLSEPLKDVVSLKLESVQIPITWYTVSNSYGSNFFLIRGRTDGINSVTYSGYHDYKIEIPPGNYVLDNTKPNYICTAIQNAITDISNLKTDTNFGNTKIEYNSSTIKTSITLDIQKNYNETNFYFDLSNSWLPYVNSTIPDISLNDYRSQAISTYLGFMNKIYTPYTIKSNQKYRNNNYNDITIYTVDNSNNTFEIIQYDYDGINTYSGNNIVSTNKIVIPNGNYYNSELTTVIQNEILNSTFLDISYSNYNLIKITDESNINYGYQYFEMNIKLNRYNIKPVPNTKVVVVFPDESYLNRPTVWTINSNYSSCFYFNNTLNETNILYAEEPFIQSNINVNNSTYIYFKCTSPLKYATTTDFSLNDITVKIPQNNYSLSEFITAINNSVLLYPELAKNTYAILENDIFNFNIDITKYFNNNDWSFKIQDNKNNISVLNEIFGISGEYNLIDLSNINYTLTNPNFNYNKYINSFTTTSNNIFQYYPNKNQNSGNYYDNSYNIITSTQTYTNFTNLIDEINTQFKKFNITDISTNITQYPLSNSLLTYIQNPDNTVSISLLINISFYLTENNYEVYFYDLEVENDLTNTANSWYDLNIDFSYNLIDLPLNEINIGKLIIGNSAITLTTLNLNSTNNKFNITPYYDIGGAYTSNNHIQITLQEGNYTINSLLSTINNIFLNDQRLTGSQFITYYYNNKEYVKLILNINIIYTSKDYDLVFYDTTNFVKCYIGASSVQNTTWDSTLGWILGFRDYTEYQLIKENQNTSQTSISINQNIINYYYLTSVNSQYIYYDYYGLNNQIINTSMLLTGDTTTTTNIYNYFLIVLDDYNQNHLNDGLVSIISKSTKISVPEYVVNSTKEVCDPTTNTPVITSITNTDGLTQKQIYAINQAQISQKQNNSIYSIGPNVQDVFAILPLRLAGQPTGTYYVETGGNLQNQSRVYFGPVTISKFSIQLQNDKGDIVDLNGSNWSFSLICEQLYRK
jgi:hypothetical protein